MPNSASSSVAKLRQKGAPPQQAAPVPVYEPTPQESEHLGRRLARKAKRAPAPMLKVDMKDGIANTGVDHPDQGVGLALLMEALSIDNLTILQGYLAGLVQACTVDQRVDEGILNSMVQTIAAMGPRDMAEAMLFAQMTMVNKSAIHYASRVLATTASPELRESYERSLNRLSRTYAAQMQTLKQCRSDGKQKIVVKHVTVNEGGQAIVGDVTHGGTGGRAAGQEATA